MIETKICWVQVNVSCKRVMRHLVLYFISSLSTPMYKALQKKSAYVSREMGLA